MFFSDQIGIEFKPYSFEHIILFIVLILGSLLLFIYKDKIRDHPSERLIAKGWAICALLLEISLYVWKTLNGQTAWHMLLPIGLCAFTLFLGIYALYFKRKRVFLIGYFWTWGAMATLLFPDILFSYDRFRFYQYMIGHLSFFFMYIYMILVYRWHPQWKDWQRSILILYIVAFILTVLSNVTHQNLMFMLRSDGTPFSMFEGHGYFLYLVGVVSLSSMITIIWYLPFYYINKRQRINH
jgi:hypothetical integral membrane protein (TIGR02206 family)